MMNKDFLKRGILLPLIFAAALCVFATVGVAKYSEAVAPFENGAEIMLFDSEKEMDSKSEAPKSGDVIGSIKSKGEMKVVYDGGYSLLTDGCLLSDRGAMFGKTGTAYVEIINRNADKFANEMTYSGALGTFNYKKTDEKTLANENEVFLTAPRAEKSVVVYFRERGKIGLSQNYRIIVYEEVA